MTTQSETDKVKAFIEELMLLYTKYGLSIAHEDSQGAFLIENDNVINREWIKCAFIEIDK